MDGTSGAVLDHEEAEAERTEAERVAAEEALVAEQAGLDADPSQQSPDEPEEADPPADPDPDPEPEDQGPYVEASGQLSLNVGGKKPTGASIALRGGKVDVAAGEFKKGDVVTLMVKASVTAIEFVDIIDPKTQQVVGCDRRHKAQIRTVELLEQE